MRYSNLSVVTFVESMMYLMSFVQVISLYLFIKTQNILVCISHTKYVLFLVGSLTSFIFIDDRLSLVRVSEVWSGRNMVWSTDKNIYLYLSTHIGS